MRDYEIVKIGNIHKIGNEVFSKDVIEIYPLDEFHFNAGFADELYIYIKGVDEEFTGAFPILAFDDGIYSECVGVLAIVPKENGEEIVLSVSPEPREIAHKFCKDAYFNDKSDVEKWSKIMRIVDDYDLLNEVIDFVDLQIGCH